MKRTWRRLIDGGFGPGVTLLVSATGRTATLGALATISTAPGETEIRRENLQRAVQVTAQLEDIDLVVLIAHHVQGFALEQKPVAVRICHPGKNQSGKAGYVRRCDRSPA